MNFATLPDGVAARAPLIAQAACSSRLCRVNMDTPPERGNDLRGL